ncbi:Protein mesh [Halotydeus destructor]|nr:Protein mesh [Halotydeus destructor]
MATTPSRVALLSGVILLLFSHLSFIIAQDIPSPPRSNQAAPVFTSPNARGMINPIITSELTRYREQLMYDYNMTYFTDITSSKPIHDQPLPFRLPFFGFDFSYIYIQKDGYLGFNKGLLSYEFPLRLPMVPRDNMVEEDPSIIAPWFALQDIPSRVPNAGVYFQIVNIGAEPNITLRDRLILDFREGMIGAADFTPKYVMIVTWRNMTMVNRRTERPMKTNTYQAIVATDEIRTYVMYNYEQIEWITHLDNYDGLKGYPAFVGFNAGNSTRSFEFRPYSQNPRISLLTQRGFGNGFDGRFFFQTDEEVWPGACIEKGLDPNLPDRLPLTFFPKYGHMLGGTMVNITGPCLSPDSIIVCRFENWKSEGFYRDPNHASCISPPVMYHGYIDLTVSVNDETLFLGRFYLQPPEVAEEDVVVLEDRDREEYPDMIPLKWHPNKLAWDMRAPITIELWGYRETNDLYPSLTFIDTLVDSGVTLGARNYELLTDQFRERNNPGKLDITFGYLAIKLTNPKVLGAKVKHSPVLWSRTMPLSWYFKRQWEFAYGEKGKWKKHMCQAWYDRESFSDRYATTVFRCPCTRQQALLDKGRFSPDLECNIIDRKCDTFHRGALGCFRSGRPSVGGSGQKCCYDDWHELIQTADTMYGGRPSRAFVYGKHPFKMRMMIPALSNWLHDEMPYFYCCKWSTGEDNSDTCQMYNYWRTSQDCSSYQPPAIGSVFGDPHFMTFDGANYTFNGRGEFTLVHVDNPVHKLDIQARFEQVPRHMRTDPSINATYLTAIAARDNQSSIVEFRIRPAAARWRYHMYAIVDKEYVFFWDDSLRVQNFRGVTLYQPAGIQNMSHIIAMFDSGAGVEVMSTGGRMIVHTYLPVTFLNGTGGLLGHFSRNRDDDLQTPDTGGSKLTIPLKSSTEDIHRRFGATWRLLEGTALRGKGASLFWHDSVTFAHYDDAGFNPVFEMPPELPDDKKYLYPEIHSICGSDSLTCQYDYVVTMDKSFAKITKVHEAWAHQVYAESRKTEIRCPALQKPLNGRKSENRYWPGTIVRFSCDDGYRLVGYENRMCRETGLWTWGVDPECISHGSYFGTIAGLSLAIVLPVLLIIGCTIFAVLASRRQSKSHYTYEQGSQPAFSEFKGNVWNARKANNFMKLQANDPSDLESEKGTPSITSDPADSIKMSPNDSPGNGSVRQIPTSAREADV